MAHATESDHKVVERARRLTAFDDFKKFVIRGNLVDLAVAVVVGTAFTGLVKALVADFITPLIAAIGGQKDFSKSFFTLHHSQFKYGDFINNVVSFVILAAIVFYFVVLPVGKIMEHFKPTPDAPAPTQDCTHCLSKVPAAATVCAFCTRDIEPTQTPAA